MRAVDLRDVHPERPARLIRVVAPHFVAGFVTDGRVVRAAPIIGYLKGWPDDKVRAYVRTKGWRASEIAAW